MILFRGHEAHSRSIVKAISWRTLGSIDTFLLGWLFTGSLLVGGALAVVEPACNTVVFHFHEKFWKRIEQRRPTGSPATTLPA